MAAFPFAFPGFVIRWMIPKRLRMESCAPKRGSSIRWRLHGNGVLVSLSTVSDEGTRAWWPHDFHLVHRATIGTQLTQELIMTNTDPGPVRFEEALHTYYRVGAAESVHIRGLDGVAYLDNTDGNREKRQAGDIVFTAQTDRAYLDTTHAVENVRPVLRRRIRLEKQNSRTTVVWNPWSTGAQSLSDLGDDEWRTMACVEASNMRAYPVDLARASSTP